MTNTKRNVIRTLGAGVGGSMMGYAAAKLSAVKNVPSIVQTTNNEIKRLSAQNLMNYRKIMNGADDAIRMFRSTSVKTISPAAAKAAAAVRTVAAIPVGVAAAALGVTTAIAAKHINNAAAALGKQLEETKIAKQAEVNLSKQLEVAKAKKAADKAKTEAPIKKSEENKRAQAAAALREAEAKRKDQQFKNVPKLDTYRGKYYPSLK
jgi:hypothetical protein